MKVKSVYVLADKNEEQVKKSFVYYMEDKDAVRKQIKNAANSRYSKIDVNSIISEISDTLFSAKNIFSLKSSEKIEMISEKLTEMIENSALESREEKELKNNRSYVNKYRDFLRYCEMLAEGLDCVVASGEDYVFEEDTDKPFISESQFLEIVSLLNHKKNIILQGAPGVGKTFLARKIAYQLMGEIDDERIDMVQFHQSYSYEDFVQGIRPNTDGSFEVRNGVFYEFCKRAIEDEDKKYVFIIDEINRGNLSKILGELMMLIESDKRSPRYAIKLTYNAFETFYVPSNVYIIGCMNTADRSIAIVDYALRRRFAFCTIEPEFGETFKGFLSEKIDTKNIEKICKRVNHVNELIRSSSSLGPGMVIGHSYFCQLDGSEDFEKWWANLCRYELFPYIQEICFDDNAFCSELCSILKG